MTTFPSVAGRRQFMPGIHLFALLVAIYFVTYSGYAISHDEWALFDATESMARRGNLQLNFQFDSSPPLSLDNAQPPAADTEPMQPVLAAPLFLAAQALPGIGLAHAVWLFNILVTALSAVIVYAYGLNLGYQPRPALATALAFGVGTIVWPYSRTFFREPLFMLLGISSAYLVRRLRHQLAAGRRPLGLALACAASLGGMVFAKEAALLLLPAIAMEAIPGRAGTFRLGRRSLVVLAAATFFFIIVFGVALNLDTVFGLSSRYAFVERIQQVRDNLGELSVPIRGYLYSPARSLWLYSPILLAGIWSLPALWRERRWRQLAVPLLALVFFVSGYAAVRGEKLWYGGLGWGPRYMVPITPFLALWLLPVFERLLEHSARLRARVAVLALLTISVGIQLVSVLVPVHAYYDTLAAHTPPIIPWHEGAWAVQWSPIWISLKLLDSTRPDWAWIVTGGQAWVLPLLSTILAAYALTRLIGWFKGRQMQRFSLAAAFAPVTFILIVLGAGLLSIRHDPRYYGDFAPTRDLLNELNSVLEAGDVIILNNEEYAEFFMNYYKQDTVTVYTLPRSPGERYSPEQPPELESTYPDALVDLSTTVIFGDLSRRYERAWLVIDSSRFVPWSVRPVEHYLARHYFPVSELAPHDIARAILFDLSPAPPPTAPAWPDTITDIIFGNQMKLVGYDLQSGPKAKAGDSLPISLVWQAVTPVSQDYTVALFLMSAEGQLVAQRDSFPVNAFEQTSTWAPGLSIRDNHGIALPDHLAPGRYHLWLAVYWWQAPEQRLPVTNAQGDSLGDHAVLATITIE